MRTYYYSVTALLFLTLFPVANAEVIKLTHQVRIERGWEPILSGNDFVTYINRDRIQKNGEKRRVWVLKDYREANAIGAVSSRSLLEVDCKEEKIRILTSTEHSGSMGDGNILNEQNSIQGWIPIPPNTGVDSIHLAVCKRK
jgi:hypothetical protein